MCFRVQIITKENELFKIPHPYFSLIWITYTTAVKRLWTCLTTTINTIQFNKYNYVSYILWLQIFLVLISVLTRQDIHIRVLVFLFRFHSPLTELHTIFLGFFSLSNILFRFINHQFSWASGKDLFWAPFALSVGEKKRISPLNLGSSYLHWRIKGCDFPQNLHLKYNQERIVRLSFISIK